MFSFNLKSAYHQIRMNKNFTKYLGFAIEEGDGRKRYFMYLSLPFGLNNAMRVLTKLMKSPLERWRSKGMKVFIHVDDGFGIVKGRLKTLKASRRVREELRKYGLLASEEKLAWGARQLLVWTGFLWDTRRFKLYVTDDKLKRVELLLEEILEQRFVKVSNPY